MPTITTGTFFVGRRGATAQSDPEHGFVLTLHVLDNQGKGRVEPYVVKWTGDAARTWWGAHGPLKAGDALRMELVNPRTFPGLRAPETHAQARACELLPARHNTAQPA